jgi:thioredoxin-like negative regulator of GroEL
MIMNKNTLLLFMTPLFIFLIFINNTSTAQNPIYLHEQISQKTTKAWDPFLNPIIGQGNVILKFFAYYCGPCRNMAPHIDDLAVEMPAFTFVKVQWEMFDILTKKFNIQSIPTLIFLRDGKEIGRYDGGPLTKNELAELILTVYGNN